MKKMKPNNNVAFIDGSMDLGAASPIEHEIMQEAKRKKIVMNESELRNYIYKKVLKVLNEDAPMDPAASMPPAGGAPMPGADTMAAGGAMPGATPPADDADRANLPGAAKTAKDKADKFKDQNGGAKGFNPQEDKEDDDDKKKDKDDK